MPHCPRHFCRCWYQHVCCPHLVFFFQVHVNRCLSLPVIYLNLCGACVFPTAPQQFKVAGSLLHPRLKRNWVASCGKASVCLVFPDFSKFCARVPLSSFQAPTHPPSMTLGGSQPCPTRCVDARVGLLPLRSVGLLGAQLSVFQIQSLSFLGQLFRILKTFVSLYLTGPRCVVLTALELINPPASASRGLGLKVCSSTPNC